MNGRISRAIYLIDDNEHPFAGWEFDNRGLALEKRTAYAQFDFEKVHKEFDTLLTRKFRTVQSGVVTLEINFILDCTDGFSVCLYNSAKETAVRLFTRGGSYVLADGVPTGVGILAERKNSFKAIVNLDNRTYTAFINNKNAGTYALPDGINDLQTISVGIEKGYCGTLHARGVKLYADYFCNERFLAPFEEEIPCDWTLSADSGKVGIKTSSGYTFSREDTYFLDIHSGVCTVLEKPLTGASGELCFELKFIEKSETLDAAFLLDDFGVYAKNGILSLSDGTEICTYPHNLWNTLRLEMTDGGTLVRLNGKDKGVFDAARPQSFSHLRITAKNGSALGLDDVLLFGLAPLPEDYVAEPVPAPTTGYHVGLHVFSSWRYGFWRGTHDATWDVCSPYDEITPYMGYYDEGIPEVADWENKWFAEHGIDFQLQCWYGPLVIDEPIKFPGFSHALHDGYFNSVYKNYSKFAIMWENNFTRSITPEAFENYLVPFFIEYYFKDPGYYKIDGKPVFSIYNIGTLVTPEYFGSVEQARKEMDFLRNAVKKAGFPDILLLCAGSGGTKDGIALREALSVEGTYAYNWGTESYTAQYQKERLSEMADTFAEYAADLVHVPTVGVGFNCVARHDQRHPSISIDEYEKILTWTRDVYLKDKRQFPDQNSWQSKMLLLSCWNEFDEGHYINPSNLHGFGFIDTLRKLFTTAPDHTDAKPTDAQKRRIDILYPEGHAWLRPERRLAPPAPDKDAKVLKTWDFADKAVFDSWNYYTDAHGKEQRNGALCGYSDGVDPQIILDGSPDFAADDVDFIHVSLKLANRTGKLVAGAPLIYFATSASPALSGNKMLSGIYAPAPDGGFSDVYFVCSGKSGWSDTVTTLRLDPHGGSGLWEIRRIDLIGSGKKKSTLCVDGSPVAIGLPITTQNGVPFVPLYAKSDLMNRLNATYHWNRAESKLTLIIGETEMVFTADSDICRCGDRNVELAGTVPLIDGVPAVPLETVCKLVGYDYICRDGETEITVK